MQESTEESHPGNGSALRPHPESRCQTVGQPGAQPGPMRGDDDDDDVSADVVPLTSVRVHSGNDKDHKDHDDSSVSKNPVAVEATAPSLAATTTTTTTTEMKKKTTQDGVSGDSKKYPHGATTKRIPRIHHVEDPRGGAPFVWRRVAYAVAFCAYVLLPAWLGSPATFYSPILGALCLVAAYRLARSVVVASTKRRCQRFGRTATATVFKRRTTLEVLSDYDVESYEVDACFLAQNGNALVVKHHLPVPDAARDATSLPVRSLVECDAVLRVEAVHQQRQKQQRQQPSFASRRRRDASSGGCRRGESSSSSSFSSETCCCLSFFFRLVLFAGLVAATGFATRAAVDEAHADSSRSWVAPLVCAIAAAWWVGFIAYVVALLASSRRPAWRIKVFDLRDPWTVVLYRRASRDARDDAPSRVTLTTPQQDVTVTLDDADGADDVEGTFEYVSKGGTTVWLVTVEPPVALPEV